MIRIIFSFSLLLFGLMKISTAQVVSELTIVFEDELNGILLNWKGGDSIELNIETGFYYYDDIIKKKPTHQETINYQFINDSIVKQTFFKPKRVYYGLIIDDYISEYDFENQVIKGVSPLLYSKKDSAGYKVITSKSVYLNDTVCSRYRYKYDNKGRMLESFSMSYDTTLSIWQYSGERTIRRNTFRINNTDTSIVCESISTNTPFDNQIQFKDTTITKSYYSDPCIVQAGITESKYKYDELGRIIEMQKIFYEFNEPIFESLDIMKLSYDKIDARRRRPKKKR